MGTPYRPLGLISSLVDQMDLTVTHAHDDIVFVEHNAFLLKMEATGERVSLYFNEESDRSERNPISETLIHNGAGMGLVIIPQGTFSMKQKDSENLEIIFNDKAQ